jgi:prepilin-type N-terminal cleavage/methylation domain-containing protein
MRRAFTIIELVFVIVILGILATVSLSKFTGITDGAKISAELSTAASIATALENTHGEWSINEGDFRWGNNQSSDSLNTQGYPDDLSANGDDLGAILKLSNSSQFKAFCRCEGNDYNITLYFGPASDPISGVVFPTQKAAGDSCDLDGKPDKNDFWLYASHIGTDKPVVNGKTINVGDFVLVDGKGDLELSETIVGTNIISLIGTSCQSIGGYDCPKDW